MYLTEKLRFYSNWDPPHGNFQTPHYSLYNKINGCPELEYVRDTLAHRGLKDPWIRNHVWKFPPWREKSTAKIMFRAYFEVGCLRGLYVAAFIISCESLYYYYKFGGIPDYCNTLWKWIHEDERKVPEHH